MAGGSADHPRVSARGAEPATRSTVGRFILRAATGLALVLVSWLAFFRDPVVSFPPEGYTLRWFRAILGQRNFVDGFLAEEGR